MADLYKSHSYWLNGIVKIDGVKTPPKAPNLFDFAIGPV